MSTTVDVGLTRGVNKDQHHHPHKFPTLSLCLRRTCPRVNQNRQNPSHSISQLCSPSISNDPHFRLMSAQFLSAPSFAYSTSEKSSMEVSEDEGGRSTQKYKVSGACVDCKSVKVRCEFIQGEKRCRRCQAKNLPCHPRERKKRKAADTHEELQERSHEQDLHIQNLLRQYDRRRAETNLRQWISKASSSNASIADSTDTHHHMKWLQKGKSPESAAVSYFSAGSGGQQSTPPGIIKHCSLYPEDIDDLFTTFFRRVNPYFSILDESYHTPAKLIWTSPFLFTVVCALASRYHPTRHKLYSLAMEFARDLAGKGLVEGHRSIDVCQAYLIMAVYPVPKKKWAEDRSWLLMGVAIRMAIELELNQPPPSICDERESLNRVRTWLNCYCADGSHAIQFGKMPMLHLDDYLARNSSNWYKASPLNTPYDVHLCAHVQMIIHMANWSVSINADTPNTNPSDIVAAALQMQETLSHEMHKWADSYAEAYKLMPLKALPICNYRGDTTQMFTSYLRLVVLLQGFQRTKVESLRRDSEILLKSIDLARSVIQITIERLYPSGFLRYAMDENFLYVSFAAAFLIHLFRPQFLPLLDEKLQKELILSVSVLIAILGSAEVALDGKHTPALYSRFLSSLMMKHALMMSDHDSLRGELANLSGLQADHQSVGSKCAQHESSSSDCFDCSNDLGWPRQEIEMGYSVSNFIKTVTHKWPSSTNVGMPEPWWKSDYAQSEPDQAAAYLDLT
ncbi:hypothetical protein M413DRAFT_99392 [Hebeloma cylindrosporum]|uniref:Zn(2)-C6 fungal-type domain-containing protein n=1 Tax=Hebeloma cylindrosporum TaxID=76867 RepID=A0A0C2YHG5_HEBCY|nr:hypothetical protein M413DRAFT_99392 [Hebeloma cylindrosporum h7]